MVCLCKYLVNIIPFYTLICNTKNLLRQESGKREIIGSDRVKNALKTFLTKNKLSVDYVSKWIFWKIKSEIKYVLLSKTCLNFRSTHMKLTKKTLKR